MKSVYIIQEKLKNLSTANYFSTHLTMSIQKTPLQPQDHPSTHLCTMLKYISKINLNHFSQSFHTKMAKLHNCKVVAVFGLDSPKLWEM